MQGYEIMHLAQDTKEISKIALCKIIAEVKNIREQAKVVILQIQLNNSKL